MDEEEISKYNKALNLQVSKQGHPVNQQTIALVVHRYAQLRSLQRKSREAALRELVDMTKISRHKISEIIAYFEKTGELIEVVYHIASLVRIFYTVLNRRPIVGRPLARSSALFLRNT